MIKRMKLSKRTKRMLMMLLIVAVYIWGRNVPLPFIQMTTPEEQPKAVSIFNIALDVTGGDLTQFSIFSLGLSPWMSTMILWRFFTMGSNWDEKKFTTRTLDSWRYLITFVIATIQSIGILPLLELQTKTINFWGWVINTKLILVLFTVAGCFYLIWLANMNSKYGIGNMTIFILAGMLIKWPQGLYQFFFESEVFESEFILPGSISIFVIMLVIVILTIIIEKSEYRITIKRILLNSRLSEQSYIPIKLNPAGGMPIMYAMTLMALPRYLLQAVNGLFPDVTYINQLNDRLSLTDPLGVSMYIVMLVLLTVGFSFVNINPDELAKTLKESSDYLLNIRPGMETQRFLNRKVFQISLIAGLYIGLVAGLPMFLAVVNDSWSFLASTPGMIIIIVSLILSVNEEIIGYGIGQQYQSLF